MLRRNPFVNYQIWYTILILRGDDLVQSSRSNSGIVERVPILGDLSVYHIMSSFGRISYEVDDSLKVICSRSFICVPLSH